MDTVEKQHFGVRIRTKTISRIRQAAAAAQTGDPMRRVVVGDLVDRLLTEALDARDATGGRP